MNKPLYIFIFSLFPLFVFAQSETNFEDSKVLWYKESYGGLVFHSSGWGLNARMGKHKTGFVKRFYEFDITSLHNAKEVKQETYYEGSKKYIYGKLNNLYVLRTGIGLQRIITHKPVWGGTELRFISLLGASIGITKPLYLYIISTSQDDAPIQVEKYNPAKHDIHRIYGKGPFFRGFNQLHVYPGLYLKTGLNFEYGTTDNSVSALEAGIILDYYNKRIPIMAYNYNSNYFISLYFSINFGTRYN